MRSLRWEGLWLWNEGRGFYEGRGHGELGRGLNRGWWEMRASKGTYLAGITFL